MTNKINLVINLSILALLIYLSVSVKQIQDKVFPDPHSMQPATGFGESLALRSNLHLLLNNVLEDAINQQEKQ